MSTNKDTFYDIKENNLADRQRLRTLTYVIGANFVILLCIVFNWNWWEGCVKVALIVSICYLLFVCALHMVLEKQYNGLFYEFDTRNECWKDYYEPEFDFKLSYRVSSRFFLSQQRHCPKLLRYPHPLQIHTPNNIHVSVLLARMPLLRPVPALRQPVEAAHKIPPSVVYRHRDLPKVDTNNAETVVGLFVRREDIRHPHKGVGQMRDDRQDQAEQTVAPIGGAQHQGCVG